MEVELDSKIEYGSYYDIEKDERMSWKYALNSYDELHPCIGNIKIHWNSI